MTPTDPPEPLVTRASLAAGLTALGVRDGGVLIVHSSITSLGFVCGGPVAVVQALLDVLGPHGTVVVPTHTPDNSDPAGWRHPPVPESWWRVIRDQTPGFDLTLTPSRHMGLIAETVRTWPGTRRSDHPHVSFAACGPDAQEITEGHPLNEALGDRSPLGRIYERDGDVLLLGVGHDSNTSLHLAEYRQQSPRRVPHGGAVLVADERQWVWWQDLDADAGDFAALGAAFDATGQTTVGTVGAATCRLMPQRAAVDFAEGWFARNRRFTG